MVRGMEGGNLRAKAGGKHSVCSEDLTDPNWLRARPNPAVKEQLSWGEGLAMSDDFRIKRRRIVVRMLIPITMKRWHLRE